jgi:hypothetical protein
MGLTPLMNTGFMNQKDYDGYVAKSRSSSVEAPAAVYLLRRLHREGRFKRA